MISEKKEIQGPAAADVGLTLFNLGRVKGWQNQVIRAAVMAGACGVRKGHACLLWEPSKVRAISNSTVRYADGVGLAGVWTDDGKAHVAVVPRRVYFEGEAQVPTSKCERELFAKKPPAPCSPSHRITACLKWAEFIHPHMPALHPVPATITQLRTNLHQKTKLVFGQGARCIAGCKTSYALMKNGPYSAPVKLNIRMVAPDILHPCVQAYRGHLANALKRCHAHGTISCKSYKQMDDIFDPDTGAEPFDRTGFCVLLAVSGKKGEPLAVEASEIISKLEAAKIPFRMFSVNNPSLDWSALDQVGSLLMAAGGVPYVLELPWPAGIIQPYLLGVDLGHPKALRESWVVLSLLDSCGTLLGSWRYRQRRDETIGASVLKKGLSWALATAQRHGGQQQPAFLVLRDGRLHEAEKVEMYSAVLGPQCALAEFAKYDNPEMYTSNPAGCPASAGTECSVGTPDTLRFVTPVKPRLASDLARTFKLHMKRQWDGLGLGMDCLCEVVTGLSYSPGLGLAQHALPAPIYWADGIAGIGETNHQFAGQFMSDDSTASIYNVHAHELVHQ